VDNYGKGQSVGNSAKIASELTALALTTGLDPDAIFDVWQGLIGKVASATIALNESVEDAPAVPAFAQAAPAVAAPAYNPVAAVQNAFPGSTVVTAPPAAPQVVAPPAAPANVVPFPQQAAAPAAIPGAAPAGGGDPAVAQAWDLFFQDVANGTWAQNWTDNRASKRGANSPDFKHNSIKQANSRYNLSLYITSNKNPADVPARLAAIGIS
jgi:hypothetical protein